MKWLRLPVAILAVTLFSGAAEEPAKTKSKSAESNTSLEGIWSVVSAQQAGREVPRNIAKTMRFVFSNTKVTIRVVDRVVAETKYTADPTQRPATIRLTFDGKETLGIYRIEGNGLMICLSGSTKERPSKFASEADSPQRMLFTLERGDLGPIGRSFFVAPPLALRCKNGRRCRKTWVSAHPTDRPMARRLPSMPGDWHGTRITERRAFISQQPTEPESRISPWGRCRVGRLTAR
jgi:uncharacterized protein (TIGR03067 family)